MRSRRNVLFAAVAGAALSGCAGLVDPSKITLSPRELDQWLDSRFPLDRRVLEVFDVTLSRPRLRLQPERDRLGTVLDVDVRERLLGGRWQGRIDFDAALRWEPRDRSIRLAQVRVQDFTLDRARDGARSEAERLGGAVVERVIEDLPIYALEAQRAERMRVAGLSPQAVHVTERGVEITFERLAR
jgi:hypothetical protein